VEKCFIVVNPFHEIAISFSIPSTSYYITNRLSSFFWKLLNSHVKSSPFMKLQLNRNLLHKQVLFSLSLPLPQNQNKRASPRAEIRFEKSSTKKHRPQNRFSTSRKSKSFPQDYGKTIRSLQLNRHSTTMGGRAEGSTPAGIPQRKHCETCDIKPLYCVAEYCG